jgi:dTDP-6-deoxy-L-talose 4-dehydrogenase (NAD+)
MSGGDQLRDYLPVEIVARKIVDLATIAQNPGVTNICSGKPISIRSLVEKWISEQAWNIRPELGRYGYPDYEAFAFWGDTSKYHREVSESQAKLKNPVIEI